MHTEERPTLLPPLPAIYGRLSEVERERKELRRLLRLALDREQDLSDSKSATSSGRRAVSR
jgi:hypothetical protein